MNTVIKDIQASDLCLPEISETFCAKYISCKTKISRVCEMMIQKTKAL